MFFIRYEAGANSYCETSVDPLGNSLDAICSNKIQYIRAKSTAQTLLEQTPRSYLY